MTTLDAVFGPKRRAKPYAPKPTHWDKSPEHLRPTLDTFESEVGFYPKSKQVLRAWERGAHDWYEEHQNNTRLLKKTIGYMRAKEILVTTPGSCVKIALSLKSTDEHEIHFGTSEAASEARRRKYGID